MYGIKRGHLLLSWGLFNVLSARVDVVLKMAKTSTLKKVKEWETKLDCKLVYDFIVNGRITKLR